MASATSVGFSKLRQERERRQPRKSFDVVGSLHGIVEILANKSQADAANQAHEKGQRNVTGLGRTRRRGRNHGGIHNAGVGRAETGGNGGFPSTCHENLIEGFFWRRPPP